MAGLCFLLLLLLPLAWACTDVLVTPEASEDGSAMIAYNADSGSMMGVLYHYPPTSGKGGEERRVFEWDTGRFLGTILEANATYNVVGNINEFGLCIGESTFGGVEILSKQEGAVLDYGSLIYITLQRTKTAREAIRTMVALMDQYGYASEGESFSIADRSGEVWIMEVIGTGSTYSRKGSVWVARRVPPGYVTAHANQARIRTFPRDDPDNCLFAADVVDMAIHYGLFSADSDPAMFSFSDVYCPVSFNSARLSEARVWSAFSQLADDSGAFQAEYLEYAAGRDTTHRMPLWIQPYKKVSLMDLTHVMSSHYEGTELDSSQDVGAGLYDGPYRPRPLVWQHEGNAYHNERTIATQQTGWNFIAQIRLNKPPHLAALTWFAVDDSSTSPRVPVYGSSRSISTAYSGRGAQDGVREPVFEFDLTKAFWVQNMVSNFAYTRWGDAYPLVRAKIDNITEAFIEVVAQVDEEAWEIYTTKGVEESINHVTQHGVRACDKLHAVWFKFYGELFSRFRDFFEILPSEDNPSCGCQVNENGMTDNWKKRIISETGDHYRVVEDDAGVKNKKGNRRDQVYSDILSIV